MTKKNESHYIDNDRLYAELCEWHARKTKAEANGDPIPKLPEFAGECIIAAAEGMAKRGNFRKYTWIQEMIGDGILDATKALNKFDPNRVSPKTGKVNPFGFINLVLWRAFGARIKTEKRANETIREMMLDPNMDFYEDDDGRTDSSIDTSDLNEFFYKGA